MTPYGGYSKGPGTPILNLKVQAIQYHNIGIQESEEPLSTFVAPHTQSPQVFEDAKAGSSGITNCFVNTIITALQAPEWEKLLER